MMISVGVIVVAGLVFGKIAQLVKLPSVTGYLIGGVLIGPAAVGLVGTQELTHMSIVSEMALALIAFSIGAEFNLRHLKKIGKNIITITIFQALTTVVAVYVTMHYLFQQEFAFSLLLAAISAATAPAATVMVIKQYKADGPLVRTLLPVVAIDDAVCILVFGLCLSIAKVATSGVSMSLLNMIKAPLVEITLSLALGLVGGMVFSIGHRRLRSNDESIAAILGVVFVSMGLAVRFHLSTLLTCMMVGATIANFLPDNKRVFALAEVFSPPIYLMFFTIAGATLHLGELSHIGMIGMAYILSRSIGKMMGAAVGASVAHAPKVILKYLGMGLLPQAGVAIGLATLVNKSFPGYGSSLTTIVLGSVVVFELIGPVMAKIAIQKAGEIGGHRAYMQPSVTLKD